MNRENTALSRTSRHLFISLCLLFSPAALSDAVVFIYHHFGVDAYPSTNIRIEQFEAQIEYLENSGHQIWPLEKIADYIYQGKKIPDNIIALTIDDAYISVLTEAYPRLIKRGWPFTVFVSTDSIDQQQSAYMSWDQMRSMKKKGVSFANHSSSHAFLINRLPDESLADWEKRVKKDIKNAQRRIEKELGKTPKLFAYPYGEYNIALKNIIEELGYIAFGQHSGAIVTNSDKYILPRYPMAERFAAMKEFIIKANSRAMPLQQPYIIEPVITNMLRPRLEVTLEESDALLEQLNCYASEQGRMDINWQDKNKRNFSIQSKHPLPIGRSRYNCTAPSASDGRYYWFSQLWIRPNQNQALPMPQMAE